MQVAPTKLLDHSEGWVLKNWCFWTVVLEKTLKSPLDCKEIKSVIPKGNESWIFIGRSMQKLKLQYFGHLMGSADSLEKILMLGKIVGRRRRDNRGWDGWMVSLTQWTWVWPSSPWGCKELDMTEWLNNKNIKQITNKKLLYSSENPTQCSVVT